MVESYSEAALRHYNDADRLAASGQLGGAGYLIGFAAECAIKRAIKLTRPRADIPHVHLPELVEGARRKLRGRQAQAVFTLLEQPDFMKGWAINIRYAPDGAVSAERFQHWCKDAKRVLGAAGLRRLPS